MTYDRWTEQDSKSASAEGWDVFTCDGYLDIQKCDEAGVFHEDASAIAHVYFAATNGSPLHLKALTLTLAETNRANIIAARGEWGAA